MSNVSYVSAMNGEGRNMYTKAIQSFFYLSDDKRSSLFLSFCLSLLFHIFPDINLIRRSKNIQMLKIFRFSRCVIFFSPRFVVVVALLFYIHGKHLRSCQDSQLT